MSTRTKKIIVLFFLALFLGSVVQSCAMTTSCGSTKRGNKKKMRRRM